VFNLKWSALSAVLGFVLSLLLSLISGAGVFALLRALIFGTAFFAVGSLLYWMVKRFLPELLNPEDGDEPGLEPGSHVDISLDDDDDISSLAAVLRQEDGESSPDGALGVEGLERLTGGGESLAGTALDHEGKTDYTNRDTGGGSSPADDFGLFASLSPEIPPGGGFSAGQDRAKVAGAARPGGDFSAEETVDVLPGPEGMSSVFSPSFSDDFMPEGGQGTPVSVAFPGVDRNSTGPGEGVSEFRGKEKESALAIQTILKRD
jgi:hypothetical protein